MRREEVVLEIAVIKKTGLDTKFAKNADEHNAICKKIFELAEFAKVNGIEKVDYIYNPISPITSAPATRPPPPNRPVPPCPIKSFSDTSSNSSKASTILSSESLSSLGEDSSLKSRISRLSKNLEMRSPVSSTNSSITSSVSGKSSVASSVNAYTIISDDETISEDGTLIEDSIVSEEKEIDITHAGCIIVYTHKNGTQSLYLGRNHEGEYSSIIDKVLENKNKVKESCIVTVSKSVTAQLPQTHVIINYDTPYVDTTISKKNIRTYLIETNEKISLSELNKTIKSMKEIGFKFNLTKFNRFPIEQINSNLTDLDNGFMFDENGTKQKITEETKKIITSFLEYNYL